MATEDPWTVQRLLSWTTDYLTRHGSDSPRLDAEILLSRATGWPRIQLYVRFDQVPDEEARARFRESIKERARGTPVAYLVGEKEFFSVPLTVTRSVLIPRPETEFVVVAALDAMPVQESRTYRVADLCTGSGAIAVAIAHRRPDVSIIASDIDPAALEVARINVRRHQLESRIQCIVGDLFEACGKAPFDVVVANPPYIGNRERANLPRDVIDHEPERALFSGEDGTLLSERLIREAPEHLVPQGSLIFETSPYLAQILADTARANPAYESVSIRKDLAGHPRVVIAKRH